MLIKSSNPTAHIIHNSRFLFIIIICYCNLLNKITKYTKAMCFFPSRIRLGSGLLKLLIRVSLATVSLVFSSLTDYHGLYRWPVCSICSSCTGWLTAGKTMQHVALSPVPPAWDQIPVISRHNPGTQQHPTLHSVLCTLQAGTVHCRLTLYTVHFRSALYCTLKVGTVKL